jgi:hypothetical protein
MNKIKIVTAFFITFIIFETLFYYLYKNRNTIKESFLLQQQQEKQSPNPPPPNKKSIKESFLEAYQGSETNYESCKKGGYPHQWCLHIQEPYSITNPDSLTECRKQL